MAITLNALALIPLGVDLYFLRDGIASCLDNNSNGLLFALTNNIEALVVSILSICHIHLRRTLNLIWCPQFLLFVFWSQQTLFVKSVTLKALILGLLTCKLLLVTGLSFLFGGFANMRAIDGSGALQFFKPLSGVSSVPILVMCCVLIVPAFVSQISTFAGSCTYSSVSQSYSD